MIKIITKMSIRLFHKLTFNDFEIKTEFEKAIDENSEEYEKLCEMYGSEVGFVRSSDPDRYDKIICKCVADYIRNENMDSVTLINETVKNVFSKDICGYVSFGGYVINPKDFCMVGVNEFEIRCVKE